MYYLILFWFFSWFFLLNRLDNIIYSKKIEVKIARLHDWSIDWDHAMN